MLLFFRADQVGNYSANLCYICVNFLSKNSWQSSYFWWQSLICSRISEIEDLYFNHWLSVLYIVVIGHLLFRYFASPHQSYVPGPGFGTAGTGSLHGTQQKRFIYRLLSINVLTGSPENVRILSPVAVHYSFRMKFVIEK